MKQVVSIEDIKKYKYISVDLFDTLIFRSVSEPSYIFSIVEYEYNNKHINGKIKNYREVRLEAERVARRKYADSDVTLELIYSKIPYEYTIREELKKIEEKVEIKNCVPNKPMVELISQCHKNGKIVILTTDMYLSAACIHQILHKIEITPNYVFISGELGQTKRAGTLFGYILDRLCISENEIIHIGDNLESDIRNAKQYGIESREPIVYPIWLDYSLKNNKYSLGINQMEMVIANYYRNMKEESELRIGYGVIGPVIYEFCRWVHNKKNELDVDRLCFVAREGYFIEQCYKTMYPQDEPIIKYISLNKNLLRIPMLKVYQGIEEIIESMPPKREYSWEQIFSCFGITETAGVVEYIRIKKYIFDNEDRVSRRKLLNHQYDEILICIKEYTQQKAEEQTEILIEYLKQNDFLGKKTALINNSINGVVQRQLTKIIKKEKINIELIGLQFLCSHKCEKELGEKVHGWLSEAQLPIHYINDFQRDSLLFEHLLFPEEGTAISFRKDKQKVYIKYDEIGDEAKNSEIVLKIQEAAMQFCVDYMNVAGYPIGVEVINRLLEFERNPIKSDAEQIASLIDKDIDGSTEMIDMEIPFSYKFLIGGKQIPNSIRWISGYMVMNNVKCLWIYRLINCIRDNGTGFQAWINLMKYKLELKMKNGIKRKIN